MTDTQAVEETDQTSDEQTVEENTEATAAQDTEQASEQAAEQTAEQGADQVEVQEAELPEAVDESSDGPVGQLDILLDTTIPVAVRLGEATFTVRELLQLAPGSVLKLERMVGEPLDLFLRGIPFAKGQLVVVGEQLGVRVTEITAQGETAQAEAKE